MEQQVRNLIHNISLITDLKNEEMWENGTSDKYYEMLHIEHEMFSNLGIRVWILER